MTSKGAPIAMIVLPFISLISEKEQKIDKVLKDLNLQQIEGRYKRNII